jgi:hypothetical protein
MSTYRTVVTSLGVGSAPVTRTGDYAGRVADSDETTSASGATESAREVFFRAVDLAKTGDHAAALPLFQRVVEMSDVPPKAFDSCIANIAICSHHLGDHATALTYTAMFLDSSASLGQDERMAMLEMFFASYKGQAGIIFHNPYNEYN